MKKLTLLISLIVGFIILFYFVTGFFLTYDKKVDSPFALVEGWISYYNMEFAANYIVANNFDSVFVVGMIKKNKRASIQQARKIKKSKDNNNNYSLLRNGLLGFTIPTDKLSINSSINITMRGTKALMHFPHYQVFSNEQLIGSGFVSEKDSTYKFFISNYFPDSITYVSINYDNDITSLHGDRNLYISGIYVDSVEMDSISNDDYFIDNGRRMYYEMISGLNRVKYYLADRGYDTAKVKLIGIEPKPFNKSIAIAQGSKDYFGQSEIEKINIITIKNHSGRSVFNFKKALKNIEFGCLIIDNHSEYENKLIYRIDERISLLFTWLYWWFH